MKKITYIIDGQTTGAIDSVPVNKLIRFVLSSDTNYKLEFT